jgi:Sortilin, neurotensin receptor 3,
MLPRVKFISINLIFLIVFSACSLSRQSAPDQALPSKTSTITPLSIQPTETEITTHQPVGPTNTETATSIVATEIPAPMIVILEMIDEKVGWAWSTTGQLLRTTDGGISWMDRTPEGYQPSLYSGFFLDGQTAWITVYFQDANRIGLLHTKNGGQNWTEYPFSPGSGLHFTDALNGWAVSGDVGAGNIYFTLSQTSDGGKTWIPIPVKPQSPEPGLPPGTIHLCNICNDAFYYNPERMVIVYGDMGSMEPSGFVSIEVSFDLGNSWEKQNFPLPKGKADALVAPDLPAFTNNNDGLLPVHLIKMNPDGSYLEQKMVFYSSQDGGKSWSLVPGELDAVPINASIQDNLSQDIFVVGEKNLYTSHDRARTWQSVASDLDFTATNTRSITGLDFVNERTGWVLLMENEVTNLYQTKDGGAHWTLITPLQIPTSRPVVTVDASIPTPTMIPSPISEPNPT